MGRYNSYPEFTAPPQTLESALRVGGQVRIRPYKSGSVKHAHVVLRKVGEEVFEDQRGRKRARAVYSLFAAKVINCKPGKEIFFSIEDYLEDRVVAFEADLQHPDDPENDVVYSAKSEETLVQQESHSRALPPKMRKMWARKEVVAVKQDAPLRSAQVKVSVGVQTSPVSESAGVRAIARPANTESINQTLQLLSTDEDVPLLSSSVDSQTVPVRLEDSSAEHVAQLHAQSTYGPVPAGERSPKLVSSLAEDVRAKIALQSESNSPNSREKSLSPMELESISSSPRYTPRISVLDLPGVESTSNARSSEKLLEETERSHTGSAVPLVGTAVFGVKKEPEESALPPSPAARPSSRSFRVPVFVPARHNPFNQSNGVRDRIPSPTSNSLAVLSNGLPGGSGRSDVSETRVRSSSPVLPPFNHPPPGGPTTYPQSAGSVETPEPQPLSALEEVPSRGNCVQRPAPTFVPATQLTQGLRSPQPPTSRLPPEPPVAATMHKFDLPPSYEDSATPEDSISRKRKRDNCAEPAVEPELRPDVTGFPIKKWKPIVKQEPLSPVLSAIPFSESASNGPGKLGSPPPAPSTLSIPRFPSLAGSSPTTSLSPQDGQTKTPTTVKAESAGHHPLTFNGLSSRPPPSAPLAYRSSRPFIDLTAPRSYRSIAPSASAPVRRIDKTRHRAAGISPSLPVIRTAQIKLEANSRDTVGIRAIAFDESGDRFAVVCRDNTVRIWDNTSFVEIAKLAHSSSVISAVWMTGDVSIASMGSNGVISKWSLVGNNKWMWEQLIDSGDADPSCFAYHGHFLAIANPRRGVRIWECRNGLWVPVQREVYRKDILTIKFINNGNELLCGCSDGTLLRCTVSSCRFQQVMAFKTKVFHVDTDPISSHALVAQALGSVHLVDYNSMGKRPFSGVLQDYSLREAEKQYNARGIHGFKPIFTDHGEAIVFGSIEGRVLMWDKRRGQISHEMDHGSDVTIQAIASFDGRNGEQHLVSCTKYGLLTWWRLPIRLF